MRFGLPGFAGSCRLLRVSTLHPARPASSLLPPFRGQAFLAKAPTGLVDIMPPLSLCLHWRAGGAGERGRQRERAVHRGQRPAHLLPRVQPVQPGGALRGMGGHIPSYTACGACGRLPLTCRGQAAWAARGVAHPAPPCPHCSCNKCLKSNLLVPRTVNVMMIMMLPSACSPAAGRGAGHEQRVCARRAHPLPARGRRLRRHLLLHRGGADGGWPGLPAESPLKVTACCRCGGCRACLHGAGIISSVHGPLRFPQPAIQPA